MVKINIDKIKDNGSWVFSVDVIEDDSNTNHTVTLLRSDYENLTDKKCEPEKLIEESFKFLLEREPKESILSEFNLTLIGKYFPEYEAVIKKVI